MKKIVSMIILILLVSMIAFGEDILESIEVYRNKINVVVNGQTVESDNFLFDSRTYVQLNEVASKLGATVSWNDNTKTASIENTISSDTVLNKPITVSITEPILSFDFTLESIESITLLENNQYFPAYFALNDSVIQIKSNEILDDKSNYNLMIKLKSGQEINQPLIISREIVFTYEGDFKMIYVPAYPLKGFNYGFYLTLPTDESKKEYQNEKRYLLVEPNNSGYPDDSNDVHVKEAIKLAEMYNTRSIADRLWLPRLIPTFPRPMSPIGNEFVYTHQLTRNTVYLEDLIKEKGAVSNNYDFTPLIRVDEQLYNMIEYGKEILNKNGENVEEKVFMWGFSASGGFVNNYVYLHPEQVKAAIYGGAPMLPLTTFKGEDLFFPYGVSDYKYITGKDFDINAYNNVAKFIYIGTADNNNPSLPDDIYNKEEKALVTKVFHTNEFPERWDIIVEAFIESEATAQIFEYIGAEHQTFYKSMGDDYLRFYNANRDSTSPVYLAPTVPSDVNVKSQGK